MADDDMKNDKQAGHDASGDPHESKYGPLGDPDDDSLGVPHPSKLDLNKPIPPDYVMKDITADYLKGAIQITGGVRPSAREKK